jgi:hypothetical protein
MPETTPSLPVQMDAMSLMGVEAQSDADGQCIPYGASTPVPPVLDPAYDQTAVPTSPAAPLPTCTPEDDEPMDTPGPSPTPLPTRVADRGGGPAVRVSSSPQNITLSPYDENLGRVAAGPRIRVVSWDNSLTLFTGGGGKAMKVSEILGVSTRAGVGVSPQGRIHVVGGGRYSYSDDGGVTWAAPMASPAGSDPFVVVGPDGYARAFWKGAGLQTAKQRSDGTWEAPTNLGSSGGDYDAVRTEDAVVAIAASGAVHRFPGGRVATIGSADRVDLIYNQGELLAGLARGGDKAVVVRSLDGGYTWSECLVQQTGAAVRDVAAVPTTQGPYAVLWIRGDGYFPSVMLSKAHWKAGEACGTWPETHQVDQLEVPYIGAPRLFSVACPQTHFRVDAYGRMVLMAFTCIDDGGKSDIFVADLSTDGFFSGPAMGGSRAGESGYRDDYLGPLE